MRRIALMSLVLVALASGLRAGHEDGWLKFRGGHNGAAVFAIDGKTVEDLLGQFSGIAGFMAGDTPLLDEVRTGGYQYADGSPYTFNQAWARVATALRCAEAGDWSGARAYLEGGLGAAAGGGWLASTGPSSGQSVLYYCNAVESNASQPWGGAPPGPGMGQQGHIIPRCGEIRAMTPTWDVPAGSAPQRWNLHHCKLVLALSAAQAKDWGTCSTELEQCCP